MNQKTKRILLLILLLFGIIGSVVFLLFGPRTYTIPTPVAIQDGSYRIMTYNLRYSASDFEAWEARKNEIVNLIEDYQPDSIGMQEADWAWMDFLSHALDNYTYCGVGRDDGDIQGEFAPIFYLSDKFVLLENGTFWLSERPNEPSHGWDAQDRRICTYVVLENNETGEVFSHFNTHLDSVGQEARKKGAELILSKIEDMEYPVVLTGDLNVIEGSNVYQILENSVLSDSKHLADNTMSWGTMNYFTNLHLQFLSPIDYVFVHEVSIHVIRYEVLYQHRYDGKPLSDHYSVYADISFLIVD